VSEPALVERQAPARGWTWLRAVLAVVTLVLSGYALVSHPAEASLQSLYDDVRAGQVEVVRLQEGLPPGSTGSAQQDVRWRTGLRAWQAPVTVVRGDSGSSAGDGRERTTDDVEAEVRRLDPAVRIERIPRPGGWSVSTGGLELTGPAAVGVSVAGLAGLRSWSPGRSRGGRPAGRGSGSRPCPVARSRSCCCPGRRRGCRLLPTLSGGSPVAGRSCWPCCWGSSRPVRRSCCGPRAADRLPRFP
jgi:hypothetical protein